MLTRFEKLHDFSIVATIYRAENAAGFFLADC